MQITDSMSHYRTSQEAINAVWDTITKKGETDKVYVDLYKAQAMTRDGI